MPSNLVFGLSVYTLTPPTDLTDVPIFVLFISINLSEIPQNKKHEIEIVVSVFFIELNISEIGFSGRWTIVVKQYG